MTRKLKTLSTLLFTALSFVQCQNYKILVGTYTRDTSSEGIYALKFDSKGVLKSKKLLAASDNPSFLAFSPDKKFVYAVNESGGQGFASAFSFDESQTTLTFLNQVPVLKGPCHISATNNHVFTANYSSGTISLLGRWRDGTLTDTLQNIIHPRKLFGQGRTGPSNAHQIIQSPNRRFFMATNLGTDRVFTYRYNPNNENEVLEYVDEIGVKRASGPRHMTFSQNGDYLYLVQELDASISVFHVAEDGKLSLIQETTLVTDETKKNGAADIHLSPDGKSLYATNRGEANTITYFKVNEDGTLTYMEQYSTHGDAPRNFAVSPDGKYIFIGNQKTDNITVYKRDKRSGKLTFISKDTELGAPVCLLFY